MKTIKSSSEFFNVKDTLECGQVFRFKPYNEGYIVLSKDKCCYAFNKGDSAFIICEDNDEEYFREYFDLARDYGVIVDSAKKCGYEILEKSATLGKGVRILNQDIYETTFSFIVSQNNNIPRIKTCIERICDAVGEKKTFKLTDAVIEYNAFPTIESLAKAPLELYKGLGLGYRAEYIKRLAQDINGGFSLEGFCGLDTNELKKELVKIYGIGPKVADCVTLFGFHRKDSFPVDVWIEKVYRENFGGELTDRKKITEYFLSIFKENSGYYQQYLFYFKRSLEKEK